MAKNSKDRIRNSWERRKNDTSFDIENQRKKEIERIADLRKKQKVHNSQDQEVMKICQEKQKLKKGNNVWKSEIKMIPIKESLIISTVMQWDVEEECKLIPLLKMILQYSF